MKRITPLNNGTTHHIYSKSISNYQIFNCPLEYERFITLLRYYRFEEIKLPFSKFARAATCNKETLDYTLTKETQNMTPSINILAFCLMPTHFHLILHQVSDAGIKDFVRKVCSSYSHYFNLRHNRKGPLWQNRFGNALINNQQELLETSRYVHLNPTTACLVDQAENWIYSSFREYTHIKEPQFPGICPTQNVLKKMSPEKYGVYVNDHVEAQRQLKKR